jgi:ABC-2 type transport system ATP-binding protein
MAHLAEARSVTVRFGSFVAVRSVSLCVDSGEVVGLLGANGAGKTTLLLTLLGLLRPSSGAALLFGSPPSTRVRQRVGYVPQTLGLYDDMTVLENWVFTARAFGRKRQLPASLADNAGDIVGDLPLGVQRTVAFAVALSHEPELLILDEPTSGVAPLSAARLWQGIHAAAEAGAGVLVTTHNLEEAEQCDRLVVMVEGRIATSGTADAVIGARTVASVHCDDWRRAFQLLDAAGLVVQARGSDLRVQASTEKVGNVLANSAMAVEVEMVPADLEEAFVDIVSGSPPS